MGNGNVESTNNGNGVPTTKEHQTKIDEKPFVNFTSHNGTEFLFDRRDCTPEPTSATHMHPLQAINEKHDYKPKADSKGSKQVQTRKGNENTKSKKRKKRNPRTVQTVLLSLKSDIIAIKNGAQFSSLAKKNQSMIGIGIMNDVHDNDQDLLLFSMG